MPTWKISCEEQAKYKYTSAQININCTELTARNISLPSGFCWGLTDQHFCNVTFFWIMLSCSMVALGYFFIHLSIPTEKPHKVIFILPSYTSQIFNSELVPLNSLCRQRDETGSFALRISWTVLGMTLWEEFILERPVSFSIEFKTSEHLHVIK